MSSSIARSRSVRTKPAAAAPTTTVTTRSATRAAAAAAAAAAVEESKAQQSRITPPSAGIPLKPRARTVSAASSSPPRTSTTVVKPPTRAVSSTLGRSTPTTRQASTSSISLREPPPKREISRYPPSTRETRPPVTPRPRSSTGTTSAVPPTTRPTPTHTRSRSSVTNLSTSAVLPTPVRERSGSNAPAVTPTRTLHRRTISVDKAATTQPPRPPSATSTTSSTPTVAQPRIRSTFSTLQQSSTPARPLAPKPPPTPAHLVPPTPSRLPPNPNVAASAEISKLQAELLQLYLLHRDAGTVDEQWKASAKKKLGEQFLKLCDENREVAERERVGVERVNVLALRRWSTGGRLDEKIQSLEAIITGVWALSDPDGRYARIVRQFEHWIDTMTEVENARKREDGLLLQGQDTLFIGELDETWKDEREGLIHRLNDWKKQLNEIDVLPDHDYDDLEGEKSSLTRMLDGSRNLIDDMLAEMTMMEQIENDALTREKEWIQRMNQDDEFDEDDDTPQARAAWRTM